MKKSMSIIATLIRIAIWSIIGIFVLPIVLLISLIQGVSLMTMFQSLWFAIQMGKEENEEEL